MKDIFKDILGIEGVHGVIVLDTEGGVLLSRFSPDYRKEESRISKMSWDSLIRELAGITEAEFVFDRRRIYVRKVQHGFFMAVLDDLAPVSMVRLNCEILQPSLDRLKPGGRIGQILKKRIF
ncbi:MAG: hypothetical protein KGY38_05565 [Desulfobacterales bacterium]|nr:hypothetical protein [Desulfobacterales bacterium]